MRGRSARGRPARGRGRRGRGRRGRRRRQLRDGRLDVGCIHVGREVGHDQAVGRHQVRRGNPAVDAPRDVGTRIVDGRPGGVVTGEHGPQPRRVVGVVGHAEHAHPVGRGFVREPLQLGHLLLARYAPARREVDQDPTAGEVGQRDVGPAGELPALHGRRRFVEQRALGLGRADGGEEGQEDGEDDQHRERRPQHDPAAAPGPGDVHPGGRWRRGEGRGRDGCGHVAAAGRPRATLAPTGASTPAPAAPLATAAPTGPETGSVGRRRRPPGHAAKALPATTTAPPTQIQLMSGSMMTPIVTAPVAGSVGVVLSVR